MSPTAWRLRFLGEHGPEYLVPTYDPAALPD
jgi:hypothetical protein